MKKLMFFHIVPMVLKNDLKEKIEKCGFSGSVLTGREFDALLLENAPKKNYY